MSRAPLHWTQAEKDELRSSNLGVNQGHPRITIGWDKGLITCMARGDFFPPMTAYTMPWDETGPQDLRDFIEDAIIAINAEGRYGWREVQ